MKGKDFLLQLNKQSINRDAIKKIEEKYAIQLPIYVQKIISCSQESVFFENDWRTLSIDEIFNASNELHVDFCKLKIVPLFDTGDNDFIVYCSENDAWAKFNIIDECLFKNKKLLEDYF